MKYEEMIKTVMHRANLSSRLEAQDALRATLETLSEHLTQGEALNFSSELPPEVTVYMQQPFIGGIADRFTLNDFIQRVSDREGVTPDVAGRHASVVANTISEGVSLGALEHLISQLPTDIAQLFMTQHAGEQPENF